MSGPPLRWDGDALLVTVHAQPRASRDEIVGLEPRGLRIRVQAAPVRGAANVRLIKVLARAFGVAKSSVSVVSGGSGREKLVRIEDPQRIPA